MRTLIRRFLAWLKSLETRCEFLGCVDQADRRVLVDEDWFGSDIYERRCSAHATVATMPPPAGVNPRGDRTGRSGIPGRKESE